MATDRDPLVSFRPAPEIKEKLDELATGKGLSLYAFMPGFIADVLKGASNDLLKADLATAQRQIETLQNKIGGLTADVDRLEREKRSQATDFQKLTRLVEKLTGEAGALEKLANMMKLENTELTARLKRVIDRAVKNSFVSRKEYEKL